MTAIARTMINGKLLVLSGAQITKTHVKNWIKSVGLQLETIIFDPATLPALIDRRAWVVIQMKNPCENWEETWDMETFLKALKEVFADRFDSDKEIWTNWVQELCYNLQVGKASMEDFSRVFTYAIVDKEARSSPSARSSSMLSQRGRTASGDTTPTSSLRRS